MALILLADDDDILLELAQLRLEADGHHVVTAEDGIEALDRLKDFRPDLVILDSVMPRLGGQEVLAAMREDSAMRDIMVMMLTALSGEAEVRHALDAGAQDYMTKPFRPDALSSRVAELLQRNRDPG